jgi:hypothetical protein
MDNSELKTFGKGMAVRAGVLAAGGLLMAGWGFALGAKAASAAIHLMLVAGVGLLGAGYITYKVKRFEHAHERPSLAV